MTMKYALFLGCTIPVRANAYEVATRKIAEPLGMELIDMNGVRCCGSPAMESVDRRTALAVAARAICEAEKMRLDLMTLCNGCAEVLGKANNTLKKDPKLREEINSILSEVGHEFKGAVEVKHLVRVLTEDVGLEAIKATIRKPFGALRVAVHPGCHMMRPSDILAFDDPIEPTALRTLVELTGAETVHYPDETECCAASVLAVREDLATEIARKKIARAVKYADIMVTACPFCYLMYEVSQLTAEEMLKLPVVHYPQLLGLAMGMDYDDLAMDENRIDCSKIKDFQT